MAEKLHMDWGSNGGKCWEFWNCDPFCGPNYCKDPKQAITCCLVWGLTGSCAMGRLFAASQGEQKCGLLNHCLLAACCGACAQVAVRHNYRLKHGVGSGDKGWVMDCLLSYFCGCCAMMQVLRSADNNDWVWWNSFEVNTGTGFKFCNAGGAPEAQSMDM